MRGFTYSCAAVFAAFFPVLSLGQTINFQQPAAYPAQRAPAAIASGDLNGDGKLDIAVGNAGSSSVSLYLGNGDGTLTPGATLAIPSGCAVTYLAARDFNNDGATDLLAVCALQNAMWFIPGSAKGQFGTPVLTRLPNLTLQGYVVFITLQGVAIGDFNNDRKLDVALALISPSNDTSVVLLAGNGDGTFQAPVTLPQVAPAVPSILMAGDFNRDGNLDLAVVLINANGDSNPFSTLTTFLGNGKGGFQPTAPTMLTTFFFATAGAIGDVNGDGIPDIVVGGISNINDDGTNIASTLDVMLGKGDGTFQQISSITENDALQTLLLADLRGVHKLDIVENWFNALNTQTNVTGGVDIRAGNGDGTFQSPFAVPVPSGDLAWAGIVAADWNGDGATDLAFPAVSSAAIGPLLNIDLGSIQNLPSLYPEFPAGQLLVSLNAAVPRLVLSSSSLTFAYAAGAALPPAQSVSISNGGSGSLAWTATASQPWLKLSAASGTAPGALSISVAPGSMTPGSYTGSVQIASAAASNSPLTVSVTLTISAAAAGPAITAVVNGASFQPGFEAGSWVTISGSDLANTNPGRTWLASEIVNGHLPTSLDGVSVTINGNPAYVYYISPTQLNVQAPSDSATGPVNVVVTNNGAVSKPFVAQLQSFAPAFFQYTGTAFAIAERYPDYALVANPASISGTVAAKPGDILILWGTGFGATDPTTPAGIAVTGAPAVAALPSVTVGGVPVTVISGVLSPGSAGLYQIAVQLPANVPAGVVPVKATVGGTQSPAAISIFVSAQ